MSFAVVAFFRSGSMLQLVLSLLVSVWFLAYHVYHRPYLQPWLNGLQGACLFLIWCVSVTTARCECFGESPMHLRIVPSPVGFVVWSMHGLESVALMLPLLLGWP